jgi:hypothetical protein
VWLYVAVAVAGLVFLKLLSTIVSATERAAAERGAQRENRKLRARIEHYSAR